MRAVVELLAGARRLVIFTGAGVSAESGIPTFRDALGGLWARYDPAALATPAAFADDPALVWGWYEWRRLKVLGVQPNPAHRAIAALSGRIADTRWSPRTSTTCMNAPAAATSFTCMAACTRRVARPARQPTGTPCPIRSSRKRDDGSSRRVVRPAADRSGRAWSGSARRCPRRRCARLSPRPASATCCSASALPAWCSRRRGYPDWRWNTVPASCM